MYILRNKNFAAQYYYYPQSYADYSRYYDKPKDPDEGLNKAIKAGAIGTVGAGALAAGAGAYAKNTIPGIKDAVENSLSGYKEAGKAVDTEKIKKGYDFVKRNFLPKDFDKRFEAAAKTNKYVGAIKNALNKSKGIVKNNKELIDLLNNKSVVEAGKNAFYRGRNGFIAGKLAKASKKAAIAGGIGTLGLGAIKLAKDAGRKGNDNKK